MRYVSFRECLELDYERALAKAFAYSVKGWYRMACEYHLKAARKRRHIEAFDQLFVASSPIP